MKGVLMFKQVSCLEAEELIQDASVVIADVRDNDSFNEAHISGAIHLSVAALQDFCETVDKNQPILLYCYHGISSQSVAQHLVEQGFSLVYSLMGGFETWRAHHPTSDDA
jgi:thiosulfate sulfurtransferase